MNIPSHILILVVGDRQLASSIADCLKQRFDGCAPLTAGSLAEAKDILQTNHPDCLIADWRLSDGLAGDLCRADGGFPTIILAETDHQAEARAAWEAGAAEVIFKSSAALTQLPWNVQQALQSRKQKSSGATADNPYKLVVDQAGEGILITRNLEILYTNDKCSQITGYSSEDVQNKSFMIKIHPDDREKVLTSHYERIHGKTIPAHYNIRYFHQSGELRWLELRSSLITWKGKPAILTFLNDITDNRQTLEALVDSEQRLSDILDFLPDATFIIDREGRVVAWNNAIEELTGIPARDMLGQDNYAYALPFYARRRPLLIDLVLNPDLPDLDEYHHLKITGDAYTGESYTPHLSGGAYLWVTAKPLYNVTGEIIGAIESIRDITERRAAEQALMASEEQLRIVFMTIPDAVAISRPEDGVYLEVNEGFLALTGFAMEEVIGRSSTELNIWTGEDDRARFIKLLRENGFVKNMELIFRAKDGHLSHVLLSANMITLHGKAHILSITKDIGDWKRAQSALKHSEERYRLLAENSTDVIFASDLEGRFTYITPSVFQLSGFTPDELLQQPVPVILTEESAQVIASHFEEELAKAHQGPTDPGIFELQQRTKNGPPVDVEVKVNWILNDSREPVGLQGIVRDIRERKRAAAEKQKLEEQLAQTNKMEAIGRLAGGVAHDFNNLLTGILGYTHILQKQLTPPDPRTAEVGEIEKAAMRAASLTQQLLTFSRKQVVSPKVTDLNQSIGEAKRMLDRILGEDIEFIVRLADQLHPVRIDPHQFDQILINLAANARDAMPDGGQLLIETANVKASEFGLEQSGASGDQDYVRVTVADTGHGMDSAIKQHLFEPFFTTKEKGKGTGLGLPIVYGIVKQNEGLIHVASEVDSGASFSIYLPRHYGEIVEEQGKPTGLIPVGQETVLLVEDENMVRILTRKALTLQGYHVLTAANGEAAIALARQHEGKISLLLTDVVMPGMNGYELHERLQCEIADLKVLFMSGYKSDAMAENAAIHKSRFIRKPFTIDNLVLAVREAIDAQ